MAVCLPAPIFNVAADGNRTSVILAKYFPNIENGGGGTCFPEKTTKHDLQDKWPKGLGQQYVVYIVVWSAMPAAPVQRVRVPLARDFGLAEAAWRRAPAVLEDADDNNTFADCGTRLGS